MMSIRSIKEKYFRGILFVKVELVKEMRVGGEDGIEKFFIGKVRLRYEG